MHFADLTSPQAGAMAIGKPVLLLPVGAMEPHGPHAPLGTDTMISEAICARASDALAGDPALRVAVLPALPYGVTRCSASFPGSLSLTETTLYQLVVELCAAARTQGFPRIVIVNSHFEAEHVAALRRAADTCGAVLFDLTRRRMAARLTDEFRSGAAHAGRYETSLILALRPDLVDDERRRHLAALTVDMPALMAQGVRDFVAMGMPDAYCGAPAQATPEEGRSTLATLTQMLIEVIREEARHAA